MNPIEKYNIKLSLVEENDADFIIGIRTDFSRSRYISATNSDIEKQKLWIKEYKKRERAEEEFYFICTDEYEIKFATYRIYNKKEDSIEIGSFVSKPLYNNAINVIKVDVILKAYVFEELNFDKLKFEVRKENKSVVNYHKKFHPTLIDEDELNYYFILEKKDFLANRVKFEKLF